MRTERALADDLVLAVHWDESDALVTAFLHGCTEEEARQISNWLEGAKAALKHPLLPTLVLAEIQLERHSRIFRRYNERYTFLFTDIKDRSEKLQTKETNLHDFGGIEIADWLARIFGMYHKQRKFQHLLASFRRNLDSVVEKGDHYWKSSDEFNIVGRLREISLQYGDLKGQSDIMADGASLLLTTVSAKT